MLHWVSARCASQLTENFLAELNHLYYDQRISEARWCDFTPTLELQQRFISFLALRLCGFTLLALGIFKRDTSKWHHTSSESLQPARETFRPFASESSCRFSAGVSLLKAPYGEEGGSKHTCTRQTDSTPISVSTSSPSASLRLVIRLAGISRGNLIHLYRCRGKRAVMGVWWQPQ